MEYKQFQIGQKVRSKLGEILTVLKQEGCQVYVVEECLGHYHPNNLYPIEKTALNHIS